jgi:hypothetical protein
MRGRGNYNPRASFRGGHGGGYGSSNYDPRASFRGGHGGGHGGNNYNPRASFRGGRGNGYYGERPNFRGGRGNGYYGERPNFRGGLGNGYYSERESFHGGRGDDGDDGKNYDTLPKLSISERKKLQQKTAIENLNSSKLTYGGSDHLVFIINGERITTVWKKKLEKTPWYQNDVRIFISSALVATDSQKAGELVTELSNPKSGLERLREILNFPMSCDAGTNETVLSFQYVILPLLGLLTRTAITKIPLEKYVDDIFMVVYENLVSTVLLTKLTKYDKHYFFLQLICLFFPQKRIRFSIQM